MSMRRTSRTARAVVFASFNFCRPIFHTDLSQAKFASSGARVPNWRPIEAAIKVRFWQSMERLEAPPCTPKNVWWLVSNPHPLGGCYSPSKTEKSLSTANFVKFWVIWKTPRIRGLNGKHNRQTSLINFVGYIKAIRAGHILSQNIRKSCRKLRLKFAEVRDCNDSMMRVVVILFCFCFYYFCSVHRRKKFVRVTPRKP
jgi:hypothetical protein